MSTVKRKRVSLGEKYKAITELESGIKPSKVAEKYDVPRNTVSTWLKKKEEIKNAFKSGEVSSKRKNMRIGQNDDLEKALFSWLKKCEQTTYQSMGQSLRRKQSAMQRNFKLRDLRLRMDGLKDGKQDLMCLSKLLPEKKHLR